MFKIDWAHLLLLLLPPHKRKPMRIAWLTVLLKPFVFIYESLMSYRERADYAAAITGQTIYLQKYLNDTFNSGNSGIVIVPVNPKTYIYVSVMAVAQDVLVGEVPDLEPDPATINYYLTLPDFVVQVPHTIVYDQAQLIAAVHKYAYASKQFIIQTI
jgi:hypothetical protein